MNSITFTKTAAPEWLLAMWKEIDDKTFGKGFDCFAEDAVCNLGVADWHGREAIALAISCHRDGPATGPSTSAENAYRLLLELLRLSEIIVRPSQHGDYDLW